MRKAGLILLIVFGVIAVAFAVIVFMGRSSLSEEQAKVEDRWATLRAPLTTRYLAVGEVNALAKEVGGDREVVRELDGALIQWRETGARGRTARDPQAEVRLANRIEGLTGRLSASIKSVPKLSANADLVKAAEALPPTVPSTRLIDPYNRAVRSYKNTLDTLRNRPAAVLFGFRPQDAYEPAT